MSTARKLIIRLRQETTKVVSQTVEQIKNTAVIGLVKKPLAAFGHLSQ